MTPFMLNTHRSQKTTGSSLRTQTYAYTFIEKVVRKPAGGLGDYLGQIQGC